MATLTCPPALNAAMTNAEVDDVMVRGYVAIKAQDLRSAEEAFLSVVTQSPDSARAPEAMLRLGHLQLHSDSVAALTTFTSLVEKRPESAEAVTAYYRIGSLNTRRHYYDDARAAFIAVSEHKEASPMNKGRARLEASFVELMKFFAKEYWGRSQDGSPQLVRSDALRIKIEHLETARKEFESIRDDYAKSKYPELAAIADCGIGEIYLLGEMPYLAERAYWRAIRQYGDMPDALITLARTGLAQALYREGKAEKALEQYDLMLSNFTVGKVHGFEVAPKSLRPATMIWKAVALHDLGRMDEALAMAQQVKGELQSNNDAKSNQLMAEAEVWEGALLTNVGRTAEAIASLRDVIEKHPDTKEALRAQSLLSELEGGN